MCSPVALACLFSVDCWLMLKTLFHIHFSIYTFTATSHVGVTCTACTMCLLVLACTQAKDGCKRPSLMPISLQMHLNLAVMMLLQCSMRHAVPRYLLEKLRDNLRETLHDHGAWGWGPLAAPNLSTAVCLAWHKEGTLAVWSPKLLLRPVSQGWRLWVFTQGDIAAASQQSCCGIASSDGCSTKQVFCSFACLDSQSFLFVTLLVPATG